MDIETAKEIPLAQILDSIGCKPTRARLRESTYSSPLREERTPSFQVNHKKNLWFDHGIAIGGTPVEFAIAYLESRNESCTIPDALRWLENMSGLASAIKPVTFTDEAREESNLVLKKAKPLEHPALLNYLKKRHIPLNFASPYIVEVVIHNQETNKEFFALGFPNEEDGHEIRNPFFKGCIGKKAISFIRGRKTKPEGIHIFEGFLDYISVLSFKGIRQFEEDTIVLNSLSWLKQATPYVKNYGYRVAYTWLDNDRAGEKGTAALAEFFKTEDRLRHRPMNTVYQPHKDVNDWHVAAHTKPAL